MASRLDIYFEKFVRDQRARRGARGGIILGSQPHNCGEVIAQERLWTLDSGFFFRFYHYSVAIS